MDGKIIRDKLIGSEEERAVSPVIGVILMVAITVILAAVIAAFVMDLGDMSESANAGINFDEDNDGVSVQVIDEGNTDAIYVEATWDDGSTDSSFFEEDGEEDTTANELEDDPDAWEVGSPSTLEHGTDVEEITVYGEVDGDAQVIATWEE